MVEWALYRLYKRVPRLGFESLVQRNHHLISSRRFHLQTSRIRWLREMSKKPNQKTLILQTSKQTNLQTSRILSIRVFGSQTGHVKPPASSPSPTPRDFFECLWFLVTKSLRAAVKDQSRLENPLQRLVGRLRLLKQRADVHACAGDLQRSMLHFAAEKCLTP